jgi:hypothetical protein
MLSKSLVSKCDLSQMVSGALFVLLGGGEDPRRCAPPLTRPKTSNPGGLFWSFSLDAGQSQAIAHLKNRSDAVHHLKNRSNAVFNLKNRLNAGSGCGRDAQGHSGLDARCQGARVRSLLPQGNAGPALNTIPRSPRCRQAHFHSNPSEMNGHIFSKMDGHIFCDG